MKLVLTFILLLFFFPGFSNGYFKFSPTARQAYEQAISLQFEEARQNVSQLKQEEPNNLIVHLIENYIDFFTVFIDEEQEVFRILEKNKNHRLDLIRRGDDFSPYYLYCQAEIKLQWALVRLKFEEYFTAFGEVKSAYKLLHKNQEEFPNFIANKKSLGILHALVGTVPDSYKWGVKLLGGMEGSIEEGRQEIAEVIAFAQKNDFVFEQETMVMYAFLLLHLNNQSDEAWSILKSPKLDPKTNPLAAFVQANVAMRTGRNDEAIRILEDRPRDRRFHPFPYLNYMHGLAKLYRLDADADVHLRTYAHTYKGINYIKEAYQKLAWFQIIRDDEKAYAYCMEQCKTKGNAILDGDKTALKEAESEIIPHKTLLQARLLFDGGYYSKAYGMLKNFSVDQLNEKRHQLEYTYRLGRICHRYNKTTEAYQYYQKTIDEGRSYDYYFACNAALQVGLLHEGQNNFEEAKKYYSLCLDLKPDEYRNGLHQKAKSGLNRLKRK